MSETLIASIAFTRQELYELTQAIPFYAKYADVSHIQALNGPTNKINEAIDSINNSPTFLG